MLANMTVFKLEFAVRTILSAANSTPRSAANPLLNNALHSYSLFISNLSMYKCWIASSFCRMPSKAITSPTPLLFHHPDPVEQHQHRFILDLEQHCCCCCCRSVFKVIRLSPVQVDCMWSWMPQTDVEI
eukprot:scaffold18262_cov78-Skeletonema_marinoi.AAC.2